MRSQQGVTRVVSVTSGKGGVGKTTITVNLATALVQQGRSVVVLDADLGLANVDVMLGMQPQYTLLDLFEGRCALSEILIQHPLGFSIIPAASGVESITSLRMEQRLQLMESVEEIASLYDYLLIDTQAGIGAEVLYFASSSAEILCVVNNEPTSLTDAYALIKVLSQNYGEKKISVIVNESDGIEQGVHTYTRLAQAVERFLHIDLSYVGCVPSDHSVREAVIRQRPVVELFPSCKASRAIMQLAQKIDAEFFSQRIKGGMQFFFRQLLEVSAHGG